MLNSASDRGAPRPCFGSSLTDATSNRAGAGDWAASRVDAASRTRAARMMRRMRPPEACRCCITSARIEAALSLAVVAPEERPAIGRRQHRRLEPAGRFRGCDLRPRRRDVALHQVSAGAKLVARFDDEVALPAPSPGLVCTRALQRPSLDRAVGVDLDV